MRWKQFLVPVENLSADEAKAFTEEHPEGTYILLDVRQPSEYEKKHIPGSTLMPLPELPNRLKDLDREKPLIAY